ncbi:trk system potassium uptake protein TrkH [Andreprevotia lacus DSM 23236]|jgi:trk system potassium uptake protein TrkH|uniref:Trk system potassium uptake protein n=1 Tax=Andreprevotia lacus DSM 23236 TaxID=1121001 RepID=A0A1W1XXW0_9NEIS|nr:potassium transporter TrkG [Andreprevotia lacus]SMC28715.1 trk system potassium uptake protein TrkH [Andreprevotia lacus DSM 23236]
MRTGTAYRVLPVIAVLARVALLFSLTLLVPITVAWFNNDAGLQPFTRALAGLLTFSLLLLLFTRRFRRELGIRDGFVLVIGLWTMLPALAAVPLRLYNPEWSLTHCYFEGMSTMTTTGVTAFSGLDHLPMSVNLWRHMLNWLGGMGILVLAVAILPMLGVGGMQLFKAETPGPIKDAKLTPRINETARNLWLIYMAMTACCALLLRYAGGLGWFDAVCHAFAALSLGGLSTHDASVGYFDSPLVEGIMIFFMLLAATNFATHYLAITGRKLSVYWRDTEFKAMLTLIGGGIVLCALYLQWWGTYPDFLTSLRHVAFNLVSIATGSGFVSTDYGQWPVVVPLAMLLLSSITACSGSTGGGIKMIRTLILLRESGRQLTTLLHPNAVRPLRVNGVSIPGPVIFAVLGFIFLYFISAVVLTFLLLITGMDFLSAFTAVIACLNNAGPGLGIVGPANNYSVLNDAQIWICTAAMLLGRLEIVSVLVVFTPAFWRS